MSKKQSESNETAASKALPSSSGSMRGYAIYAGYVRSKNDGDHHFISYGQLIDLYGLDPSKCFDGTRHENWRGRNRGEWHIVRPDMHGRYNRFRQSNKLL